MISEYPNSSESQNGGSNTGTSNGYSKFDADTASNLGETQEMGG